MISKGQNPILDKTLDFSLKLIEYCELLEKDKKYVIAKQLLRSGTSVGANAREAQNAESLADFIHKMKIALKECEETDYWLLLCENSKSYPSPSGLISLNSELWKILTSIVSKSKKRKQIG